MIIEEATIEDFEYIWPIFEDVVRSGTTYVYSPDTTKEKAFDIWMARPKKTFIVRSPDGDVIATYYIKENRPDLGSHVCRCGFMVSSSVRRHGIGEKMCLHALKTAKELGYRGMQLGYVVSTNESSVNLWLKMGFAKVGVVPKAFQHRDFGDVDVFIMYKSLTD